MPVVVEGGGGGSGGCLAKAGCASLVGRVSAELVLLAEPREVDEPPIGTLDLD